MKNLLANLEDGPPMTKQVLTKTVIDYSEKLSFPLTELTALIVLLLEISEERKIEVMNFLLNC